jgi:Ca-activated chloride channel homolog
MSSPPDYYNLLGIRRDATLEEIRKAYFEAAQRLHPDKNVAPGETEMFLDIQQAYETLADPKKRASYDSALPQQATSPAAVTCDVIYGRQNLLRLDEPQVFYALLEIRPVERGQQAASPPLNACLVLDRSTSMQGPKMDVVKTTAVQLIRRLRSQDILSVVVFSDRAEVLVPARGDREAGKVEARIQMLQPSGGTEILQGLRAGLDEVRQNLNPGRVNHLILLTDGQTYGDEQACLALAEQAAAQGVGISAMGIGADWNDAFLDALAIRTGGTSSFIADPQDIQPLLLEKFDRLARVYAEDVTLGFETEPGVSLRYAFRIEPEAGSMALESPLRLGQVLLDVPLRVLLELTVPPLTSGAKTMRMLDGKLNLRVAGQQAIPAPLLLSLEREVSDAASSEPPPQVLLQALSRLSLYRMQERARAEAEAGEYGKASQHLQYLATHLLSQGERALARTVLLEADHIQRTGKLSGEGRKKIKYGTRALLLSGDVKEQA